MESTPKSPKHQGATTVSEHPQVLTDRQENGDTRGMPRLRKLRKYLDPNVRSHNSMYIKRFILDTIERTTGASQNGSTPKAWIKLAKWEDPPEGNADAPGEFWRTQVADRGKDARSPLVLC